MKLGWKHASAPASKPQQPHTPALGAAGAATALLALIIFIAPAANAGLFTVGPDYKRPTNSVPPAYKAEELGTWKQGEPLDNIPKGAWWQVFREPVLDELESQSGRANQNLKAAMASLEQARATARVARSELLPRLDFNPSYSRQRFSPNQEPSFGPLTANTFSTPLDLSYEIDLWGRVRRGFESARADAQASLASFYSILLTLESDIAQN
ncbi:MAG TPA: TolC family protein, partial [Candidatus Dormibacteraeota bacterium]|nr:TolC family protein [Candidatus Dormibacteraeota bacterium]